MVDFSGYSYIEGGHDRMSTLNNATVSISRNKFVGGLFRGKNGRCYMITAIRSHRIRGIYAWRNTNQAASAWERLQQRHLPNTENIAPAAPSSECTWLKNKQRQIYCSTCIAPCMPGNHLPCHSKSFESQHQGSYQVSTERTDVRSWHCVTKT